MHESLLVLKSLQPLAVLHLHYRAASWLVARNLPFKSIPPVKKNIKNFRTTKVEDIEGIMRQREKTRKHKRVGDERRVLDNSDAENVIRIKDEEVVNDNNSETLLKLKLMTKSLL